MNPRLEDNGDNNDLTADRTLASIFSSRLVSHPFDWHLLNTAFGASEF